MVGGGVYENSRVFFLLLFCFCFFVLFCLFCFVVFFFCFFFVFFFCFFFFIERISGLEPSIELTVVFI